MKDKFIKYFTFAVWQEGKFYVAQCLNVDVSSFGKTYDEAVRNLKEAVDLYLEDAPSHKVLKIEKPSILIETMRYA
jgi:predicted RNase H-like HicB family nuclease